MGNCSTKGACSTNVQGNMAPANQKSASSSNLYESMNIDFTSITSTLEDQMWWHSMITWVGVPFFGALQAFVPFLQPSCETGFRDVTLIFVALYEGHHIYSESKTWYSMTSLLAPPEISVLRHLGVLRRRKTYFWLGFIESLELYANVIFPSVAHSCDAHLTARWQATWDVVPVVGPVMVTILNYVRFWGFCLILVAINVFVNGWMGMLQMRRNRAKSSIVVSKAKDCIPGDVFFNFALSAETALMPTVAMLSEEIASERKFKYDMDKDSTDAMKARNEIAYGKTSVGQAQDLELVNFQEEERIAKAAKFYFISVMLVKVLIGYCMLLWLQSAFYAVTFDVTGKEAKIKIIISMCFSTITALVRCKIILPKLGAIGAVLTAIALCAIAFSGAKVYYTYKCNSHLWNLSTGCVVLGD